MTDIDAIRARHVRFVTVPVCTFCRQPWPCHTAVVLAALDEAERKIGKTWGTIIDTHRAELDAVRADADRLAAALDECHKRCEAFQTGGRGEMFPRAYDLDHAVGENDEGCTYCYALAAHREVSGSGS